MECKKDDKENNLAGKNCGRYFLRALYVWLYHGICKTPPEARYYVLNLRDKEKKKGLERFRDLFKGIQ